jgi:hypothetical protein
MSLQEFMDGPCRTCGRRSTRHVTPEGNTEGTAFSETQRFQDESRKLGNLTPASGPTTLHFLCLFLRKIILARLKKLKNDFPKNRRRRKSPRMTEVEHWMEFMRTFGPKT